MPVRHADLYSIWAPTRCHSENEPAMLEVSRAKGLPQLWGPSGSWNPWSVDLPYTSLRTVLLQVRPHGESTKEKNPCSKMPQNRIITYSRHQKLHQVNPSTKACSHCSVQQHVFAQIKSLARLHYLSPGRNLIQLLQLHFGRRFWHGPRWSDEATSDECFWNMTTAVE